MAALSGGQGNKMAAETDKTVKKELVETKKQLNML